MAFLFGGSLSLSQLAVKFGWPSVILAIVLMPFTIVLRHIFAFPFFLRWTPHAPLKMFTRYTYPEHEDLLHKEIYASGTSPIASPNGFNCYADIEGGKWFEAFFGILHVMDLEVSEDGHEVHISPHFLSIWPVFVDFHYGEKPIHEHTLEFSSYVLGLMSLNPIMWVTFLPVTAGIGWFASGPGKAFLDGKGATVTNKLSPFEEEDQALVA